MLSTSDLQSHLQAAGFYDAQPDGYLGPRTDAAVEGFLRSKHVEGFERWADARQRVAAMQAILGDAGIDAGKVDGFVGPQTRYALEVYVARTANNGRPVPEIENATEIALAAPPPPVRELTPTPTGAGISLPSTKPKWPKQTEAAMNAFFGAKGTNQIKMTFPFPMWVAWNLSQTVTSTSCNRKCRESFERIWVNTLVHYGLKQIALLRLDLFGGLLNVRKMRGGNAWSIHSWGCAYDVDPEHNQFRWKRAQASLDNAEYDAFWRFVEAEGGTSLGRRLDMDYMHFQFADL